MSGYESDNSREDCELSQSGDKYEDPLKRLVLQHILSVESSGSFATSRTYKEYVQPGISVDGVGRIGLPLSHSDAKSLIKVSRQASCGKGTKTVIDNKVRETWEIDGDKVCFENKAWESWFQGVVQQVARELRVAGGAENVKAELYKMLIYEDGAMFKPHKE